MFPFSDQKFFWGQNNFLGLKHLRLKFFQSKIFLDSNFFRPKIIVPKLYLKLEFDTEDQVLLFEFSTKRLPPPLVEKN